MNWLLRLGINRGLMGGNRFFATLGAVAAFIRVLQRIAGTSPKSIYTHKLKAEEVLVITDAKSRR